VFNITNKKPCPDDSCKNKDQCFQWFALQAFVINQNKMATLEIIENIRVVNLRIQRPRK